MSRSYRVRDPDPLRPAPDVLLQPIARGVAEDSRALPGVRSFRVTGERGRTIAILQIPSDVAVPGFVTAMIDAFAAVWPQYVRNPPTSKEER